MTKFIKFAGDALLFKIKGMTILMIISFFNGCVKNGHYKTKCLGNLFISKINVHTLNQHKSFLKQY